jgi:zinc/manganese transport system ATP-binding protein
VLSSRAKPVVSTQSLVEWREASCGYDRGPVLRDVTLSLRRGDFVALLGPSGAGKTTVLRSMMGAVRFYGGDITVDGVSVRHKQPRVGYVPQLQTIDWTFPLTVEEAALMGCTAQSRWWPWYPSRLRREVGEVLDRLGIADLRHRHIGTLSGGQQQRVFLARALASNQDLLLLDEPTSSLDIKSRDEILHLLAELNRQGVTIVLATHEINAVAAHLPQVVCVNGTIVAAGSPAEVFTPEVMLRTYGAELPIVHYEGLVLVAERPHLLGFNGRDGVSGRALTG